LLRTLSRFIPFEPFSFLNGYGWHDTLTETQLVREKRTGVKGRWYFMVFPFFLLVGLVSYFAHEEYQDYKSRQYSINAHNESIKTLEHELKHITTDHFIEIQDIDHSYSSDKIYLKVEEIETDQLTVAVVQVNNDYSSSLFRVEKIYTKNKNFLSKIPISLDSLKQSYTADYSEYRRAKRNSRLLYDERRFEIIGIHRLFCPVIRDRGTGSINQNSISISLFNVGWPADIIEIKNLEGNISWENQLPERIESVTSNDYPYFSLNGNNYKRGDTYKFHLIIADSLNRKYTYLVEGKDFKKTVKRIN
jgi:hypothetical protein